MANVATKPRVGLPLPADLELRYGAQVAFRGVAKDVERDADDDVTSETVRDITGWMITTDVEVYDGVSYETLVDELVQRDGVGDDTQVECVITDAATGLVRLDILSGLCPTNPPEGEHVIVFVYLQLTDNVAPNPNVLTRRFIISYAHNAEFA